jgi:hypothetical protein
LRWGWFFLFLIRKDFIGADRILLLLYFFDGLIDVFILRLQVDASVRLFIERGLLRRYLFLDWFLEVLPILIEILFLIYIFLLLNLFLLRLGSLLLRLLHSFLLFLGRGLDFLE